MLVVDTDVLIYAANSDAPEHARCRGLLEGWRAQVTPWCLTWGIVYDFLRVATHPRVFRQPFAIDAAWRFVSALLASPCTRRC